jgi:hypothetical protein
MPFKDADRSLRDIVEAIGSIETFTYRIGFEEFCEDPKTAAVERKLQIISEARFVLPAMPKPGVRACHGGTYGAWVIGCVINSSASSWR